MDLELDAVVTTVDDWVLSFDYAYETLVAHFGTHSLKGYGVEDLELGIRAAGAALHYLAETQKGTLPHIRRLSRYSSTEFMLLDPQTGKVIHELAPPHLIGATDLAFHPDGKHIFSSGRDQLVKIWQLEDGKHVREFGKAKERGNWISGISISPNKRARLVSPFNRGHNV